NGERRAHPAVSGLWAELRGAYKRFSRRNSLRSQHRPERIKLSDGQRDRVSDTPRTSGPQSLACAVRDRRALHSQRAIDAGLGISAGHSLGTWPLSHVTGCETLAWSASSSFSRYAERGCADGSGEDIVPAGSLFSCTLAVQCSAWH